MAGIVTPAKGTHVTLHNMDNLLGFSHKGKNYQIKFVKQKIGTGAEQELDLAKLKNEEKLALVTQAIRTIKVMEGLQNTPEGLLGTSFTLHFSSTYKEPSILNKLGISKHKPNPFDIDSITYKDASGVEQKHIVDLSKYEQAGQNKIRGEIQPLNTTIDDLFSKNVYNAPPLKYDIAKPL